MKEHKVTINPTHLTGIHTLNRIFNLPNFTRSQPEIDTAGLFYSYMIQAGVNKFVVPSSMIEQIPSSRFLRKRISTYDVKEFAFTCLIVENAFRKLLPKQYQDWPEYSDIRGLKIFLVNLLEGLQRKTSVVSILSIPEIGKLRGILPYELLIPIENLMSNLRAELVGLPVPRFSISVDNLNQFHEILTSDLFLKYRQDHLRLEDSSTSLKEAIYKLRKSGKKIVDSFQKLLFLKTVALRILPITGKLVDTIWGKLPGIIADFAGKLIVDRTNEGNRLVIYPFDSVTTDILHSRISALATQTKRRVKSRGSKK